MGRSRRSAGFTILEILVVVMLMGIVASLLVRIPMGGLGATLRAGARELAADLDYTMQRTLATGRPHRWVVDLDQQRFRIEEIRIEPPDPAPTLPTHEGLLSLAPPRPHASFEPAANRTGEWRRLSSTSIGIGEVQVGDLVVRERTASIAFDAVGATAPARILIADESGHALELRIVAFTGEVEIVEATP